MSPDMRNHPKPQAQHVVARSSDLGSGVRKFETGATRDADRDKLDYEGFLSPLVLERYAIYMHKHRHMAGPNALRDSDNWQHGIPQASYVKSGWRHFMDWWCEHRGLPSREGLEEALCGLMFNVMGALHETLKAKLKDYPRPDDEGAL